MSGCQSFEVQSQQRHGLVKKLKIDCWESVFLIRFEWQLHLYQ